jgi:hypothetical protein
MKPREQFDMATVIPAHAAERLKRLRSSAHSTGVFTSDFSVDEFLLVRKADFEPIGVCVGTYVYHVGVQQLEQEPGARRAVEGDVSRPRTGDELHARLGNRDAGRRHRRHQGDDQATGMGRAIAGIHRHRHRRGAWRRRAHDGGPFTSDLSGQDFWSLLHSGYRPVEMVMGSCVYHVAHRGMLSGSAPSVATSN